MKNNCVVCVFGALTLYLSSSAVHADVISFIEGLIIDGTSYDVTIHNDPYYSFSTLWDADNDGLFGSGGSVFSDAPMFWGDLSTAIIAAQSIAAYLGDNGHLTYSDGTDSFLVPYGETITDQEDTINAVLDGYILPGATVIGTNGFSEFGMDQVYPWVSFELSANVPIPPALWLFGSGLMGLIGVARRKN